MEPSWAHINHAGTGNVPRTHRMVTKFPSVNGFLGKYNYGP
jgi:hypothetical protein